VKFVQAVTPDAAATRAQWRPAHLLRGAAAPAGPLAMLLAGLLALAVGHWLFSSGFLRGLGPFWNQQDNDITQYLAGYNAFVREPWHWPLLRLTSINAPQGTLATFLDTVPLYALLLKLWQHGPDTPFRNPYAHWISLCFVLQGVAAWWLCREAQLRSWLALAALTLLLAAFPPFAYRINHISLMSQWLLLFGLAVYLRGARLGRLASGAWVALLLVAFYINIYLFCMLGLLFAADLWRHGALGGWRRSAATAAAAGALLGASLFVTMLPPAGNAGGGEWGFGFFSMNLLGPFAGGRLLQFQHPIAQEGQGEGYGYLGIFLLLATAYALALRRRADPGFWRRHQALMTALVFMTWFSLSNIVYLGTVEVFHLDLPEWCEKFTTTLRASARFFWPAGYALTVFTVLTLSRYLAPWRAAVVLLALLYLQYWDLQPHRDRVLASVSIAGQERLREPLWSGFLGQDVKALQVYPPFGCGKATGLQTLLPTMMYAVRHQMTVSTGYIARVKKPCDNYAAEIAGIQSPATAFVFIKADFAEVGAAQQLLGTSPAAECIDADFAWLCKRQPATAMESKP
jgi:hypothetical protein